MSFYFFFAFHFQEFKYGMLVWFSLGLPYSWFPQCLGSVGLCLLPARGIVSHNFVEYFASPVLFPSAGFS